MLVHRCHRNRPLAVEHFRHIEEIAQMIFRRIRLREVIVHPVAIDIPASLTQIIRSELYPVPAGVHVAEVAETELVEILVFLMF